MPGALGIEMEILFATPWFVSSRNRRWGKKIAMDSPPERPNPYNNGLLNAIEDTNAGLMPKLAYPTNS